MGILLHKVPLHKQRFKMKLLFVALLSLLICQKASSDDSGVSLSESEELPTMHHPRPSFNLTVIVLTMNRPQSLQRLLDSLLTTDFEFDDDFFDVEIHISKNTPHFL